jgi:hypothetical protein
MSYLHSNLFSLVLCTVYLTNGTRSNRRIVEFVKQLINTFSKSLSKAILSLFERMHRYMLAQMRKFHCHFVTNNISSMAEVLEAFDPDYSRTFDGLHKDPKPDVFSNFE